MWKSWEKIEKKCVMINHLSWEITIWIQGNHHLDSGKSPWDSPQHTFPIPWEKTHFSSFLLFFLPVLIHSSRLFWIWSRVSLALRKPQRSRKTAHRECMVKQTGSWDVHLVDFELCSWKMWRVCLAAWLKYGVPAYHTAVDVNLRSGLP